MSDDRQEHRCGVESQEIVWKEADNFEGPDEPGYCLPLYSGGDVYYLVIKFCPWCGKKLEK